MIIPLSSESMSLYSEGDIFFFLKLYGRIRKQWEVVSIMLAMCDEKEILRDYIESEKYEAAKEAATQLLKEDYR